MHTPKITATFGDKRLGRVNVYLKALSITSAILFCSVTLTGCFKTERQRRLKLNVLQVMLFLV